jgi:hypothetical protein
MMIDISNAYSMRVKSEENLSNPDVVIPDSMKNNESKEESLTFPNPKKSAMQLMTLFTEYEEFKCNVGIENANDVKRYVQDFLATVKPNNKATPMSIKESHAQLETSLLAIRDSFSKVYDSECQAFLKAEAKRFRRVVFLLSLRYHK